MQGNEYEESENFLQRARKIFEERESEFKMREDAFREKEANLQALVKHISTEKEVNERNRNDIEKIKATLNQQKEEQAEKQAELEEKLEMLKAERIALEKQEKNQIMKYNLQLEQVRNDRMKLERLTADYEYRMSLVDHGIAEEVHDIESINLDQYVSVEEHEKQMCSLKESSEHNLIVLNTKLETLLKENKELKETVQEMQRERTKLLHKIMELQSSKEDSQTEDENVPKAVALGVSKKTELEESVPEVDEELTARVLQSYLRKNEPQFDKLEIRHSEDGELLYGEKRGLEYHFLFTEPAAFDISAARKKSSGLRKRLETYNEKFPGVQFRYDDAEKRIYATGYFTNRLKVYELMQKVQEIANCFQQE